MPTIARTAASITGLVAVFLLVLYLAYGSGDGGDSNTTPEPSAAVAASRTPRPQVTAPPQPSPSPSYLAGDLTGTSVIPLRQGDPIDLPDGIALIIETGCWQCDGPTSSLDRIYRDPSGKIRTETLVSAVALGLTDDSREPSPIVAFDAFPDASWIVVAFCTAGDCNLLGPPGASVRTTFFESNDGGITWSQIADRPGSFRGIMLIPSSQGHRRDVLLFPNEPGEYGQPRPPDFRYLISGDTMVPPRGSGNFPQPIVAPSGQVFWFTNSSRLLTSTGDKFFTAGNATYLTGDITRDLNGTRWAIPWSYPSGNGPATYLLSLVDQNGHAVRSLQYDRYISWGMNGGDDTLYGNADIEPALLAVELPDPATTFLPVEICLNDAIFHPILEPFTDKQFSFGRNRVVAIQRGTFARVVGVDGSCLNLRDIPSVDAGINACAADGVLLRAGRSDESGEWLEVLTPDGSYGWAATEFLEY
jgi:hypothetical protein